MSQKKALIDFLNLTLILRLIRIPKKQQTVTKFFKKIVESFIYDDGEHAAGFGQKIHLRPASNNQDDTLVKTSWEDSMKKPTATTTGVSFRFFSFTAPIWLGHFVVAKGDGFLNSF